MTCMLRFIAFAGPPPGCWHRLPSQGGPQLQCNFGVDGSTSRQAASDISTDQSDYNLGAGEYVLYTTNKLKQAC